MGIFDKLIFETFQAETAYYGDYLVATMLNPGRLLAGVEVDGEYVFNEPLRIECLALSTVIFALMNSVFSDGSSYFEPKLIFNKIVDANCLVLVFYHDTLVGFGSSMLLSQAPCCFFNGGFVAKEHQGRGIGRILTQERVRHASRNVIFFSTSSPRSYYTIRSFCDALYPSPTACAMSDPVTVVFQLLSLYYSWHLDEDSGLFLQTKKYCDYAEMPLSKDEVLNEWFRRAVYKDQPSTNHSLYCIGTLPQ